MAHGDEEGRGRQYIRELRCPHEPQHARVHQQPKQLHEVHRPQQKQTVGDAPVARAQLDVRHRAAVVDALLVDAAVRGRARRGARGATCAALRHRGAHLARLRCRVRRRGSRRTFARAVRRFAVRRVLARVGLHHFALRQPTSGLRTVAGAPSHAAEGIWLVAHRGRSRPFGGTPETGPRAGA